MRCSKVLENGNQCSFETDSEIGLKRHFTTDHGGYYVSELKAAGIEPNDRDIARALDGGNTSIHDVLRSAPDSENAEEKRAGKSKTSKVKSQDADDLAEFTRLRPMMIKRWERRLRVPFSIWAKLADDPEIKLSEEEITEGAEMHVDFCQAMGWLKAGKIEAVADLTMWWGGMVIARSELGKHLMSMIESESPKPPLTKPN